MTTAAAASSSTAPRFGKYLVPTTCRSCLDPVCMIGCPVGSIHRGNNGEILIEDWCIGCEACASQCPYGDPDAQGRDHPRVLLRLAVRLGARHSPTTGRRAAVAIVTRQIGSAPFVFDREFRSSLQSARQRYGQANGPILFRCDFEESNSELLGPETEFILSLTSMDENLNVWLNGKPLVATGRSNRSPGVLSLSLQEVAQDNGWWEIDVQMLPAFLKAGMNTVALRVTPSSGGSDRLLDLRLDREEGATVKLVEQKAVVCDLCRRPIRSTPRVSPPCPHDAAIRIDALIQLSTL